MIGLLVASALQTLLVLGRVTYEQTIGKVLGAGEAIGVWPVATGCLAFASGRGSAVWRGWALSVGVAVFCWWWASGEAGSSMRSSLSVLSLR
jgi:hypothetical protein